MININCSNTPPPKPEGCLEIGNIFLRNGIIYNHESGFIYDYDTKEPIGTGELAPGGVIRCQLFNEDHPKPKKAKMLKM